MPSRKESKDLNAVIKEQVNREFNCKELGEKTFPVTVCIKRNILRPEYASCTYYYIEPIKDYYRRKFKKLQTVIHKVSFTLTNIDDMLDNSMICGYVNELAKCYNIINMSKEEKLQEQIGKNELEYHLNTLSLYMYHDDIVLTENSSEDISSDTLEGLLEICNSIYPDCIATVKDLEPIVIPAYANRVSVNPELRSMSSFSR